MYRFKTLCDACTGEFKDRGSKFLAYAFPVSNGHDVKEKLEDLRTLHPKATHHCYAYRLGTGMDRYRANDDGEPSGSAGRPILGQIDSAGLTNVLVVVVRYYGGTKLGVAGLINAYKKAAADALDQGEFAERELTATYTLTCDYSNMNEMLNFLRRLDISIVKKEFDELCTLRIVLKLSEEQQVLQQIKGHHKFECEIRKFE